MSRVLQQLADLADRAFPRTAGPDERFSELMPDLMEGVTPEKLLRAMVRAITPKQEPRIDLYHVAPIRASVADAVSELVASLPGYRSVTFRKLTENQIERLEVVVRFLALLELYKQGLVDLEQADRFGDIQVRWIGNEAMASSAAMAIDDYEG